MLYKEGEHMENQVRDLKKCIKITKRNTRTAGRNRRGSESKGRAGWSLPLCGSWRDCETAHERRSRNDF